MLNLTKKIFVLFLPVFVLGCATTHAPRGWLENPNDLKTDSHGGWLNLETKTKTKLAGELIAISADSIFIVNELFHAIAQSDIRSARLVVYKSYAEGMGGLGFLGTLSTISHGIVLVFTAPLWIIGGSSAAAIRSFEPIIDYPKKELSRFAPFARYPQGLPSGINRNQIKIKPGA